jgi:hypothetical protein
MAAEILSLVNTIKAEVLEGEDGELLHVSFRARASEEQLECCEQRLGTRVPHELRSLLALSNGMVLFGQQIMGSAELIHYHKQGLVVFHNWGNGDFDAITTRDGEYPEGSIVFVNHSPDIIVKVESSLSRWLVRVVGEIRKKGTLLHPCDYRMRDEIGVYGHVLDELRGIDCELNRSE